MPVVSARLHIVTPHDPAPLQGPAPSLRGVGGRGVLSQKSTLA